MFQLYGMYIDAVHFYVHVLTFSKCGTSKRQNTKMRFVIEENPNCAVLTNEP